MLWQGAGTGAPLPGEPPEPTCSLAACRGETLSSGRLLYACCARTKNRCYFLSRESFLDRNNFPS